jgi:hypothetical protein
MKSRVLCTTTNEQATKRFHDEDTVLLRFERSKSINPLNLTWYKKTTKAYRVEQWRKEASKMHPFKSRDFRIKLRKILLNNLLNNITNTTFYNFSTFFYLTEIF